MSISKVSLLGNGWGRWSGGWIAERRLLCRNGEWILEEHGAERARWPAFDDAVLDLWKDRCRRDHRPWIIGWMDYEEAAFLGGDLPTNPPDRSVINGCWLIEPRESSIPFTEADAGGPGGTVCTWSLEREAYEDGVEDIRSRIAAGEVYQVNLCRQLSVTGGPASLSVFVDAAARGGAPDYLAWMDFGDAELACASMELLLAKRGDRLETRPIKGTRPRGRSAEEDRRLAADLESDPKERAELAMIVDLERNDLGRVCETGTVEVVDPGSVRSYATVHHLVARVAGQARAGVPWWRVLAAMVPGGSVTGCPKMAAMRVINDLEPVPRGPFTGLLGVVAGDGDLEIALPIRTVWRVGTSIRLGAGCGIVWGSKPEAEERESRLKVARWLDLVGSVD